MGQSEIATEGVTERGERGRERERDGRKGEGERTRGGERERELDGVI